jgi:1-acyl-sn-glycerol-3-phosphate acyltransferase
MWHAPGAMNVAEDSDVLLEPPRDAKPAAVATEIPATTAAAAPTSNPDPSPEQFAFDNAPSGWTDAVQRLPKVYGLTSQERERVHERNKTFSAPPSSSSGTSLANGVVIAAVSLASKAYMRGLNSMYTYRLGVLTDAIEHRQHGVGLLTVSNHRSVADDPIMLSALLPPRIILRPGLMRWGMCSVDICFQNSAFARFVTLGKALPVMRYGSLGQSFVRDAADKLASGQWLHIYPEGRVVQSGMGYMKRGVGKMLAIAHERASLGLSAIAKSAAVDSSPQRGVIRSDFEQQGPGLPIVLPMYHEGIENVMPQDRETHALFSIVPRVGQRIFTIVGDPIDMRDTFEKLMPPCARAGGTKTDASECIALYEAIADRCALSVRLLRAELRLRVRADHGIFLGDPYECT